MCLAIGGVNEPSADAKKLWPELWAKWHVSQPDNGTHSATGWALRTWDAPLPEVPQKQSHGDEVDWQLTKTGLTMIRIPAGQVERPEEDRKVSDERKTFRIAERVLAQRSGGDGRSVPCVPGGQGGRETG